MDLEIDDSTAAHIIVAILAGPTITLAEQRAAMRMLRAQGRREVDGPLLFKTALRQQNDKLHADSPQAP